MAAALALSLVGSGCLAGPAADVPLTADPVECEGPPGVAFWKFEDSGSWDRDKLRIGYYAPEGSELLFVAWVDGFPLGAIDVTGGPTHADGAVIELDRRLTGEHEVNVVVHRDSDGDGEFDLGSDPPCLDGDGEVVQTGPTTVHFSRLGTPVDSRIGAAT